MTCVARFFTLNCCGLSRKRWAQQYTNCWGWSEFMFLTPSKWITLQHSCGPHILKYAVLTFQNLWSPHSEICGSHIQKFSVPTFQNLWSHIPKSAVQLSEICGPQIPKSVVPTFQNLWLLDSKNCGPTFRNLQFNLPKSVVPTFQKLQSPFHIPKSVVPTFRNIQSPHSEIYEFRHHDTQYDHHLQGYWVI
jgi:hypothetical protein